MVWLAVLAIIVLMVASVVAVRSVTDARRRLAASLARLSHLRDATDSLALTVDDVARRGRSTGDAVTAPTRS
jgi:hypothetical protein